MFSRGGVLQIRWPLQHKSSLIFRFRRKSRTKRWLADLSSEGFVLLARRARFLNSAHFVWQAWHFQDIFKTFFCVTGANTFSSAWRAWHCPHVAKMLAGMGKSEKCSWRPFFVAGAVFDELGRRLDRVENCVLWNRRRIWFGTWWWFRVAGARLRMPWAQFSWGAVLCGLRQKVTET